MSNNSIRSFSFTYNFFIEEKKIRVCKVFYLNTLCISQQRINYFYNQKCTQTGSTLPDQRGKVPSRVTEDVEKQFIKDHILSFPTVPSHYCRKDTTKEFLAPHLNITKMYELYVEKCNTENRPFQKVWLYRHIFNYEFNLNFFTPKKDQCPKCVKAESSEMTEDEKSVHAQHVKEKIAVRNEKKNDTKKLSEDTELICFDMQRVLQCPISEVSVFYYSRKLSLFNLTGKALKSKKTYCVMWHEGTSGRGGNEIASALYTMLKKFITEFPHVKNLILWSDSCVAQNRNSIMSTALLRFMQEYNVCILQKFQEPGHSAV